MRAKRFGMGASAMASGRSPSMDKISTRVACGAGVGVRVAVDAGVPVSVGAVVCVGVSVNVDVKDAVGGTISMGAKLGN